MLDLTPQERRILLFVSFMMALGLGLSFFAKSKDGGSCLFEVSLRKTSPVLNINAATRDELIGLPGIGPKAADDIIAARARLGGFKDIRELKDVAGISDSKLEALKSNLCIE